MTRSPALGEAGDEYYEVLQRSSWLESKRIAGGTGSEPLAAQIDGANEALAALRESAGPS